MPRIYERTFRIRHYECDAYGHVNHANYLRFMQETALDASAVVGYDIPRYEALGLQWLIRETGIRYVRPLLYGDSVIVKTWVEDFRRVRSRRAYELRHAETGDLVADATTDWVLLDAVTQRPVSVPQEMILAFMPEGIPAQAPRREPFPAPPPPPAHGPFTISRQVNWRHLDGVHHMNNANYLAFMEDCGVLVADAFGWPLQRLMDAHFGVVARDYRIEYKLPALLGDLLTIATYVSDVRRATFVRHYTMTRQADQAVLARARVLLVWIDLRTGYPCRIPADFLAECGGNISAG